jgi:phosphate transport system permease protein
MKPGGAAPSSRRSLQLFPFRNWGDGLFLAIVASVAFALLGVFCLLVLILVQGSWITLQEYGWGFLFSTQWSPGQIHTTFGAVPFIEGTLVTSAIAMLLAVPVSLGIAIFLSEQSPNWLRTPLGSLVELLAAIPSVIYGFWGIFVLVPIMRFDVEPALQKMFPGNPLFAGPASGSDVLTASVILAVMVIPTISALSRDALSAVPQSQREAALSLGATKWETTRMAVLKYARSGIVGAIILGLGRAVGETMAVTMTIGNMDGTFTSLLSQGQTMASLIATEMGGADYAQYRSAVVEIALILLAITILINVGARILIWRMVRKTGEVTA